MTREDFWKHIEQIDRTALGLGKENVAIRPLEVSLSTLTPADLESFEEHLSQCLFTLDGRAYADAAGESAGSDDAFLYARCFVVAQGREHYEATLKDPSLMPQTLAGWCESLLYVHHRAWAALTGKNESEWAFEAAVSFESGSNIELWPC